MKHAWMNRSGKINNMHFMKLNLKIPTTITHRLICLKQAQTCRVIQTRLLDCYISTLGTPFDQLRTRTNCCINKVQCQILMCFTLHETYINTDTFNVITLKKKIISLKTWTLLCRGQQKWCLNYIKCISKKEKGDMSKRRGYLCCKWLIARFHHRKHISAPQMWHARTPSTSIDFSPMGSEQTQSS